MLTIVVISLLLLGLCTPVTALGAILGSGAECLAATQELVLTGVPGERVNLTHSALAQFFGTSAYPALTLTSLPAPESGTLFLGGVRPSVGQGIPYHAVEKLYFTPASPLVSEATFTFTAGEAFGGASITCRIRFTDKPNTPPVTTSKSASLVTASGHALLGTLAGYDPDGDGLEYLIVSYPTHGSLKMLDSTCGDFRYTPKNGFSGNDRFTYVVRDSYGSYSNLTTVSITVDAKSGRVDFADMDSSQNRTQAEEMVKRGIMDSIPKEENEHFDENGSVTREAWVVMVLKSVGVYLPYSAAPSIFDDDASVSAAARPYIKYAAERGYIIGELSGVHLNLNPSAVITRGEAAEILYRVMEDNGLFEGSVPVGAMGEGAEAIAVLNLAGFFPYRAGALWENGALTRGVAADILWRIIAGSGE
jgi:hypothetical protein